MGYKTVVPAAPDWFFVQTKNHADELNSPRQAISRVAAWAITDDGAVVGLHGFQGLDFQGGPTQIIACAQAMKGTFKHIDDFNTDDYASWVAQDKEKRAGLPPRGRTL